MLLKTSFPYTGGFLCCPNKMVRFRSMKRALRNESNGGCRTGAADKKGVCALTVHTLLLCRLSADGEYEFVYGSCRKSGIALPASGGKDGNRECFMPLRKRGFHRTRQRRIGRNMAGTKFITLILVTPSIFRLMATISSEPTQVISATTASLRRGARLLAASVMIA